MVGDYVFNFLFHYLPGIDTLRSVHRLIFFQQVILFLIIYTGVQTIQTVQSKVKYLAFAALTIVLIGIPAFFISSNAYLVYSAKIPRDYFELKEYLANIRDGKVDNKKKKIFEEFCSGEDLSALSVLHEVECRL